MPAITPKPVGEVTVPSELGGYEVFRIDAYALYGCDNMTKLIIPDCVHQCGGSTFRGCSSMMEVYLPERLEFIAGNMFRDCLSLKNVVVPSDVEKIDQYAFSQCKSLTNITFEGNAPIVGSPCFSGINTSCVVQVSCKTLGWSVDERGRWNGMPLEYIESKQDIIEELKDFVDPKMAEYIKDEKSYAAFWSWALGLQGVPFDKVKSSPNTWFSYALDSAGLIADGPKEGNLAIAGFGSGEAEGKFEILVSVEGVPAGNGATDANLRKVFEIEGSSAIMRSNGTGNDFSADNVEVSVAEPSDGKVKFTVAPKLDGGKTTDSFFFKVKMK